MTAILYLRFARPSFETYRELFTVLEDVSPVVQALPPDSALMDVTGAQRYFRRTPAELADLLQTRLLARYGLHTAIGGGDTRLLATLTAQTCRPGETLILGDDPDTDTAFLRGRPVQALPGVGPVLARTLARYGITTIGDLGDLPPATLQRIAGASTGRLLHDRAHGTDPRRITPTGPPASIAAGHRFDHDVLDPDDVRRTLLALATDLGTRLRASHQVARQVELQVSYADRSHTSRARTLAEPTGHTPVLRDALYGIHTALGLQRARVRAVTARVVQLTPAARGYVQLTLDRGIEDRRRLEPVLDKAIARYGTGTLGPAALTGPARPRPFRR
ncbi:DNA polymerase thumb domain-containing protein [Kitasatospora sp. NPDC052896]|uniref:DNA polymerase Y family protein n=1 Tax=Kitasatospora sp. NPDC052896 TaxID=3364061 RepID=UPI0037C676E4